MRSAAGRVPAVGREPPGWGRVKVAGAIWIPPHDFENRYAEIPSGRPVVMYCNCPNEATAAKMARLLVEKGYHEVWPLLGGLDGWMELGYPTETVGPVASGLTSIVTANT